MAFYLLLMAGCVAAGRCFDIESSPEKRRFFTVAFTIVLILLAALRSESIGSDTPQYCFVYPRIAANPLAFSFQYERYEAGFTIFCKLLGYISPHPRFLLVITSIIFTSAIAYTIYRNSCDVAMSFALLIGLNIFSVFISMMRQSLATAIIMFALEGFLKKGRRLPYILAVLLAATLHASALTGLLMLLPFSKKYSLKSFAICMLCGLAGLFLSRPLFLLACALFDRFNPYIGSDYFAANYFGPVLQLLLFGGILVFSLIYIPMERPAEYPGSKLIRQGTKAEPLSDTLNLCFWLASFDVVLTMMNMQLMVWNRIRFYFECYTICLLPWALRQERQQNIRFLLQGLCLLVAMAYFVVINGLRPEWSSVVPYKFFFQ